MKRYGYLFAEIISFENLYLSLKLASKGKRYKNYVLDFHINLESNLLSLQKALLNKTYKPGKYTKFIIYDPKKREISSAPFIDRIVHHALCNIIAPIFEKTFIDNSFANQIGKGTHKAGQLSKSRKKIK